MGDLAKIGKLPKLLKIVDNVVNMAKTDAKFAKVVRPLLEGLKGAPDKLPLNKLPDWAKEPIESLKNKIDEFFSIAKKIERTEPSLPPNPNRLPEGKPKKTNLNDKDQSIFAPRKERTNQPKRLPNTVTKSNSFPIRLKAKFRESKNLILKLKEKFSTTMLRERPALETLPEPWRKNLEKHKRIDLC